MRRFVLSILALAAVACGPAAAAPPEGCQVNDDGSATCYVPQEHPEDELGGWHFEESPW